MSYSILIAGSTKNTLECAKSLYQDDRFKIVGILTPSPRKIGRSQKLMQNPVHNWAEEKHLPTFLIAKKIPSPAKLDLPICDFILVVDFGYLIPDWVLELPSIAPINVHPSDLPKYRGSSPGQFTLLYGEKNSAVSVIIMNDKLDEGNLIYQENFLVSPNWTSQDFYDHAFTLIANKLPKIMAEYAVDRHSEAQPLQSPTPIARRLNRDDGFVDWQTISALIQAKKISPTDLGKTSKLLIEIATQLDSVPKTLDNAARAFFPWPNLWTRIPTNKGEKRMKILQIKLLDKKIVLEQVQIEGLQPSTFSAIKNQLI